MIVNDIDHEQAEDVAKEIIGMGGKAAANSSNITSPEGAQKIVDDCVKHFGMINIMVANAGVSRDRTFLKMTEGELDDVLNVHFKGTFFCLQSAAKKMKDQGLGGALITTVSAAHFGNYGQTNYAAAKGAIASTTYTLSLELARYGIRVNGISPTATTRMNESFRGEGGKKVEMPYFPPELNGPILVYLCSDEANYVSGQIFGTGAERIAILNQPSYGTAMFMPGGWTIDAIRKNFKPQLGGLLQRIGLMKPPYPYYDGVHPPEKKD